MSNYKLFISSAGIGSRLKTHTNFRNKALLTLGLKPAIAHIIDKFPPDVPVVIAVGYKKDSLIEVLSEFYPDRSIEFVYVDNYDGVGSGLGLSMLCCEKYLQCPFIFVPNDTLIFSSNINLNPEKYGNWIGLFNNNGDKVDPAHYRCAEIGNDSLISILPKGLNTENVYIGLCGVLDFQNFWTKMRSSETAIEEGESFGLNGLKNIKPIFFSDWYDTGNINRIERAFIKYNDNTHNILPKIEEAIWMHGDKCIKYHKDVLFIEDRLRRLNHLPGEMTPEIINRGKNFFSYRFSNGKLLSNYCDVNNFLKFLNKAESALWKNRSQNFEHSIEIQNKFYKEKTFERVELYLQRFDQKDQITLINEIKVPTVSDILHKIRWEEFYKGAIWANFHGDLHGDNIVVEGNGKFTLLDWRQNFGDDNYEFGDIYYDLGKLMHGLVVRHPMIAQKRYLINQIDESSVNLDVDNSLSFFQIRLFFEDWIVQNGYDLRRVKQVMALIFINIAALHDFPYSKFLFHLGQLQMSEMFNYD